MRTYQIEIDDAQRALIECALRAFTPTVPNVTICDHEERDLLVSMLADLATIPDTETGSQMLHGFCL